MSCRWLLQAYADFLKCLNMFAEDILAKQELVRCVRCALRKWQALVVVVVLLLLLLPPLPPPVPRVPPLLVTTSCALLLPHLSHAAWCTTSLASTPTSWVSCF